MQIRAPVDFDEIPPDQLQAICRTVIDIAREQFARPEIQKEFEIWKAKRNGTMPPERVTAPN